MTLALSLATEWSAGHVRTAALGVATFASARLKVLGAEPGVYLHLPRVIGYVAAPVGLWVLFIVGVRLAWKAVFA